jgi:hypothetical protein
MADIVEKRLGRRDIISHHDGWGQSMMGERQVHQDALFYEFSLERHVPERHLLRLIDRFVELDALRRELAPFYSAIGRPSWCRLAAVPRNGLGAHTFAQVVSGTACG